MTCKLFHPRGIDFVLDVAGIKGYAPDFQQLVRESIRSDNGSEFTAKAVREWLTNVGVKTL